VNWPKPFRVLWSTWGLVWLITLTLAGAVGLVLMSLVRTSESGRQLVARNWARWLMHGVACPVRVEGLDNLEPGATYVFASNHTSALDIPALLMVLPKNFRWLAKKELFEVPVFGWTLKASGYIPIDRSHSRAALKSLNQAAERIARGASVVVFPEGTRGVDGELLPFKSGGLALAIRAQRPVAPVAITGAARALAPNSLSLNPGPVRIVIGTPIPTQGVKMGQREELAHEVRRAVVELLQPASQA